MGTIPRFRSCKAAGMILASAVLFVLVWAWNSHTPPLLSRATRVADVRTWWENDCRNAVQAVPYRWLSETRLVFSTAGNSPGSAISTRRLWPYKAPHATFETPASVRELWYPFLYDTDTRQESSLSALREQACWYGPAEVSPDNKWILLPYPLNEVRVSRVDGSDTHVWRLPFSGRAIWLDDSRHWVAAEWNDVLVKRAVVGDVTTPDTLAPVVPATAKLWYTPITGIDSESTAQIRLTEGDLAERLPSEKRPYRTVSLHLPAGTKWRDPEDGCVYDPHSHQLASLLEGGGVSAAAALLYRWIPMLRVKPKPRVELWLCKPDGSGMRAIGYVPANPDSDVEDGPYCLQWLPNGKRVSFIYKDALWTVPVDR